MNPLSMMSDVFKQLLAKHFVSGLIIYLFVIWLPLTLFLGFLNFLRFLHLKSEIIKIITPLADSKLKNVTIKTLTDTELINETIKTLTTLTNTPLIIIFISFIVGILFNYLKLYNIFSDILCIDDEINPNKFRQDKEELNAFNQNSDAIEKKLYQKLSTLILDDYIKSQKQEIFLAIEDARIEPRLIMTITISMFINIFLSAVLLCLVFCLMSLTDYTMLTIIIAILGLIYILIILIGFLRIRNEVIDRYKHLNNYTILMISKAYQEINKDDTSSLSISPASYFEKFKNKIL